MYDFDLVTVSVFAVDLPFCVTLIVCESAPGADTVMVAVRGLQSLFAIAVTVASPLPCVAVSGLMVNHDWFELAVQPAFETIGSESVSPFIGNVLIVLIGEIINSTIVA